SRAEHQADGPAAHVDLAVERADERGHVLRLVAEVGVHLDHDARAHRERAKPSRPERPRPRSVVRWIRCRRGSVRAASATSFHVPSGESSSITTTSKPGPSARSSRASGRMFKASLYVGSVTTTAGAGPSGRGDWEAMDVVVRCP